MSNPAVLTLSNQTTLKPEFFVVRQNGAMVPLIAMDELPIHVQVRGVPRNLSAIDIQGMTHAGLRESRHQYHVVEGINNTRPILNTNSKETQMPWPRVCLPGSQTNTTGLLESPDTSPVLSAAAPRPVVLLPELPTGGLEELPSNDMTSVSSSLPSLPASIDLESKLCGTASGTVFTTDKPSASSTPEPVLSWRQTAVGPDLALARIDQALPRVDQALHRVGKKYCSYWLRTGECDFVQQGCKYKHEMPKDLETLKTVGLQDIPAWYRQRYGLGSLLVENGQIRPSYSIADSKPPTRNFRVGDNASRMIRFHIGSGQAGGRGGNKAAGGGSGGGGGGGGVGNSRVNERNAKEKAAQAEAEAEQEKKRQAEIDLETAMKMDEEEEKERKELAAKYKSLMPERRSAFFGHEDLASDTFSNGEATNDLMAQIREREQAGWEEEQAEARAQAEGKANKMDGSPKAANSGGKNRARGGRKR